MYKNLHAILRRFFDPLRSNHEIQIKIPECTTEIIQTRDQEWKEVIILRNSSRKRMEENRDIHQSLETK